MKYTFHITVILLLFCSVAMAQERDWRSYLEQLAEERSDEEYADETSVENIFQELSMLETNPMNLNTVTRNQLERFPLLTFEQATSLADFLEKNRPVYTAFELRNVPLLDFNTVELILPFFYVAEMAVRKVTAKEMLKTGRSEIQLRFDKTLTKRAGYGEFSDSILQRYPNRKYRGEDFYTSLKYAFAYRDKIQFGLLGEKDAGEPFLKTGYRKGYDHYGIHLIVRDVGRFRTLAIGDYRLSFGQGLVLNNDFMLSKSWATNNIIRRTQDPKRHFSTAEYGFFRGAAAVFDIRNFSLTAFYSRKNIDVNLSNFNEITSFKTDGYHRTPSEMEKKKNAREQVAGVNINYRNRDLQIGVSGVYYNYNKMYNPTLRNYNIYYLRDSANLNASIDYSYRINRFSFAGETAIAKNGAIATTNMFQYSPSSLLSFSALHRFFPITYNALYAQAFSEGSRVQNEHGLYLGASFSPVRKVSVTTYIDLFKFPWLKYQVDTPSKGIDLYFLGNYSIHRESNIEIRYKFKQKERNFTLPDDKIASVFHYDTHKLRLRYNNTLQNGWFFRTTLDGVVYKPKLLAQEKGWMLSQNIGYRGNDKVSGDVFAGFFNADSYNTRLYSYERNILTTFYMPSFYGKGFRLALSGRYNITPKLAFSVKCGYTRYSDRETIGSGTELIVGNNRTDIFTYLRWKF